MNQPAGSKIVIFHLYRKDGRTLFLHPFEDPQSILALEEVDEVRGKYGQEPQVEGLTLFRDDLYRAVDGAVKSWIQDRRFIPNILLSAAFFLMVYFILSFAIRDPIPMVDEFILAVLSTVAFYWYRLKRDRTRPQATDLSERLKEKIDRIEFREDGFVKEVEGLLHRFESISQERFLESMLAAAETSFSSSDLEDAQQLLGYLEKRFSGKIYRRQEKIIEQYETLSDSTGRIDKPISLVNMGKIDISLFLTYRIIKRECCQKV